MSNTRAQWSGRLGFILAAAGSAIGLGNLWKFPYITYENNGAVREYVVPVGFYVSQNDFVSAFDTRIGGTSLDLGPNSVYTRQDTVTIPSSTATGSYYLGPVLDEPSNISEIAEWNNATYLPIEVYCPPYVVCVPLPPPVIF